LKKAAAEAGLSRSQYDRVRDLALKRMGAAPSRANGELVKTPPAGLPTDYTPVEGIKEIAEAEKWEKLFARASRQTVTRRRARERLFPNPKTAPGGANYSESPKQRRGGGAFWATLKRPAPPTFLGGNS